VVTQPDRKKGRSKGPVAPPVKQAAQELGLPVAQPERMQGDVVEKIREAARSLGTDVKVGVSSFPDDALNLEDLLRQAEDDLKKNQLEKIDAAQNEIDTHLNEK